MNLDGLAYRARRRLPGQMASAMWGEQLAEDLKSTGLVADAACPAAFGCPGMGATVHVNDGLVGGTTEGLMLSNMFSSRSTSLRSRTTT